MCPPKIVCDSNGFSLETLKIQNVTNDCSCQQISSNFLGQQGRNVNIIVKYHIFLVGLLLTVSRQNITF